MHKCCSAVLDEKIKTNGDNSRHFAILMHFHRYKNKRAPFLDKCPLSTSAWLYFIPQGLFFRWEIERGQEVDGQKAKSRENVGNGQATMEWWRNRENKTFLENRGNHWFSTNTAKLEPPSRVDNAHPLTEPRLLQMTSRRWHYRGRRVLPTGCTQQHSSTLNTHEKLTRPCWLIWDKSRLRNWTGSRGIMWSGCWLARGSLLQHHWSLPASSMFSSVGKALN